MATAQFEFPVANVHGAIQKHGAIHRQKIFRSPDGKIIKRGKKEIYHRANPRDYDKTPLTPAEQAHHNRFRQAWLEMTRIQSYAKPENNPMPEQLAELESWKTRFIAQLPGVRGNHADPEAPIDPITGKGKRYVQFQAFIRVIIMSQLKQSQN